MIGSKLCGFRYAFIFKGLLCNFVRAEGYMHVSFGVL